MKSSYEDTENSASSLNRKIYLQLKHSIFSGVYCQGDELNESEIAKQLRISKTPVRQAVRELYKDGLVIMRPRKSSLVKQFTREDLEQTLPFLIHLETFALQELAADGDEHRMKELLNNVITTKEELFEAKHELFSSTGNIKMVECWLYSSGAIRVMMNRVIRMLDMEHHVSLFREMISSLLARDLQNAIKKTQEAYAEIEGKLLRLY